MSTWNRLPMAVRVLGTATCVAILPFALYVGYAGGNAGAASVHQWWSGASPVGFIGGFLLATSAILAPAFLVGGLLGFVLWASWRVLAGHR